MCTDFFLLGKLQLNKTNPETKGGETLMRTYLWKRQKTPAATQLHPSASSAQAEHSSSRAALKLLHHSDNREWLHPPALPVHLH